MKKQLLILSVVTVSMILFSCSKEKSDMPTNEQTINEEMVAPSKPTIDPLSLNLEGCYEFNNSLVDKTNKLGTPYSSAEKVQYGPDRKGNPTGSIQFQGNHYLYLPAVPRKANSSISVWIKYNSADTAGILNGSVPKLSQYNNSIIGATSNPAGPVNEYSFQLRPDNGWHHIVIAADPSSSKFYLDGKLVKIISASMLIPNGFSEYFIGSAGVVDFWNGAMDDLRFYSRTLTATDVKALFGTTLDTSIQ